MNGEPAPIAPPTVEITVEKHETVKTSGDPPPAVIADDNPRKYLAVAVIAQFLLVVGYIVYAVKGVEASNAEMMILGAEIGFVTTVINYYFGSSSGSTSKSQLLEGKR
jgi:hypothetical protein